MVVNTRVVSEPVSGQIPGCRFFARALDAREGAPENRRLSPAAKNWRGSKTSKSRQSVSANILATQGPRSPVTEAQLAALEPVLEQMGKGARL